MSTYLLDVNLLLALADPMHIHHEAAHRWFAASGAASWATCPLTENGFVRIAGHPHYPNRPGGVEAVLTILREFCSDPAHHFWPEDVSIRDVIQPGTVVTHAQITDVFLLGLAVHREGKLATLDRHVPVGAIQNGSKALELIVP